LIIKVASIPQARLQVYFLDNEEFFKRKSLFVDEEGQPFEDNVERMVFFSKGVMEIVRKFGWAPDIIHCHGPITGLIPMFVKRLYQNDPIFSYSKVVYSAYTDVISSSFNNRFWEIAAINDLEMDDVRVFGEGDHIDINAGAMKYSDGIIVANENESDKAMSIAQDMNIPVMPFASDDEHLEGIVSFYKENFAV
jgi:starch synthase